MPSLPNVNSNGTTNGFIRPLSVENSHKSSLNNFANQGTNNSNNSNGTNKSSEFKSYALNSNSNLNLETGSKKVKSFLQDKTQVNKNNF